MTIRNVKIFWADAPKAGYKQVVDYDVPFKAEGCLHFEADVHLVWFITKKLKFCICIH